MKKCILLPFLLICYSSFSQYIGGNADGFTNSGIVGIRIDGVILSNSALFSGGDGDGASTDISNVLLAGNIAIIYKGGLNDGHDRALTSASLTGSIISQLFSGGTGDGFDSFLVTPTLDGQTTSVLFSGGNGDGFNSLNGNALQLQGVIVSIYEGGSSDGFDKQIITDLIMGGMTANIFGGGDGDGFNILLSNALTLSGNTAGIYEGGEGSGFMMSALEGFLFQALPVEWVSFEAKQKGSVVLLTWSTASEINNDRFEIERAFEDLNFEKIDELRGAGNSTSLISYESTDDSPRNGINYYRIKQIDFDGLSSYTDIKSIVYDNRQAFNVQIYPNPNKDRVLNINMSGVDIDEKIDLAIYDNQGKLLKSMIISPQQRLDLPWNWSVGIYHLKMSTRTKQMTKRLMIVD